MKLLLLSTCFLLLCKTAFVFTANFSGSDYLDTEQKYRVSWNISDTGAKDEMIYFEVVAETTGYVGFGISPNGGMTGADILVAGVNRDGSIYGQDLHGVGNQEPIPDAHHNWVMTLAKENGTHTTLHFNRLANTCDDQDLPITKGTMQIIWSLGKSDGLTYHANKRGSKATNFYLNDDGNHPFDPSAFGKEEIAISMEMPAQETTYWCTIHRFPKLPRKHHIIAFEPILPNEDAIRHTHHFLLFRCITPYLLDADIFFGNWSIQGGHPGDYCYGDSDFSRIYQHLCERTLVYAWAVGGKALHFPPEVGLPIPEELGRNEYYALQVHYNNPELRSNVKFQTGARIFYTSKLREKDAGLFMISHEFNSASLTIPPETKDFIIAGHCSSQCTEHFLPEGGITVFNNLLHSHMAGRALKLRHFRGKQELVWLDEESNYNFDYQQSKMLSPYRKVEKGDMLTLECTYDSTLAKGGRAVIGGLETHQEMCQSWMYYYPKMDMVFCGSEQREEEHFKLLGVTRHERKRSKLPGDKPKYNILEPEHLSGDYLESVSYKVNWTTTFREFYQREKRFGEQECTCVTNMGYPIQGAVKYPESVKEYVLPNVCNGAAQRPPKLLENASGRPSCGLTWLLTEMLFVGWAMIFRENW